MSKLIFTLDVEEWFHSENVAPCWSGQFSNYSSLYVVSELLEFLEERGSIGTFFFLGCIASKHKKLIRKVASKGHEIASHGLSHDLLHNMSKQQLEDDIYKSTAILEDIIGEKVVGYRSPCFSQSEFLIDALIDNGYLYTSNGIESTFHDRYANNLITDTKIRDFPLPVASLLKFKLPATGGGWFRLFPMGLQRYLLSLSEQQVKVFYAHPVDFDAKLPPLNFINFTKNFRQTVNIRNSMTKLRKLEFSDRPLKAYLDMKRS